MERDGVKYSRRQDDPRLREFFESYRRKFHGSRRAAEEFHRVHADNRRTAGFRIETKDLQFPIFAAQACGARIRDVDGNDLIDLSMGFGVNLFGHNPEFIQKGVKEQLDAGIQLGPHNVLAGEVAQQIVDMCGVERVAFCNSGTEAVMTALRLARAVTGRRLVAMFRASYHGHFDGTLAGAHRDGSRIAMPITPGTTSNMLADVLLLDYGNPASIETLQRHQHDVAAVLVEPVQSRNPGLQPREFIRTLREWTVRNDAVLIFDEMITGFRLKQQGAQAWYDVDADIVTYGKIIGGGLPIGVVAGKIRYLDAIDGGKWEFGDESFPQVDPVFFAGTFCKHPLTLRAAHSVLRHLESAGPSLQDDLNSLTSEFVASLNSLFQDLDIPVSVAHCGSMFRFESSLDLSMFYYYLTYNGVYVWEGRTCYLSTAHGKGELREIRDAVAGSVEQMVRSGLVRPENTSRAKELNSADQRHNGSRSGVTGGHSGLVKADAVSSEFPLTAAQQLIWDTANCDDSAFQAYNISATVNIGGPLDANVLQEALDRLVDRHEGMRLVIGSLGQHQALLPSAAGMLELRDAANIPTHGNASPVTVDLHTGPPYCCQLMSGDRSQHRLSVTTHYLVSDGWSMELLFRELWGTYHSLISGGMPEFDSAMSFREYCRRCEATVGNSEMHRHELFWRAQLEQLDAGLALPGDFARDGCRSWEGGRHSVRLSESVRKALRAVCRRLRVTEFAVLFTAFDLAISEHFDARNVVVGIPTSGRDIEGSESVVGHCVNILPAVIHGAEYQTATEQISQTAARLNKLLEHRAYPVARILTSDAGAVCAGESICNVAFNKDKTVRFPDHASLALSVVKEPLQYSRYDLSVNISEIGEEAITVDVDFRTALFAHESIRSFARKYLQKIELLTSGNVAIT